MSNIQFILGSILYILLPIVYAFNPSLFLLFLLIDMYLLWHLKFGKDTKIFCIYLMAFSFFGVSIFAIKVYDIVILIFLILYLPRVLKYWSDSVTIYFSIAFLMYIMGTFLIAYDSSFDSSGFVEISRYIFAIATMFLVITFELDRKQIRKFIPKLSILLVLQSLVMNFLNRKEMVNDFESLFLSVKIFSDDKEMRISSFFSDPNKFMCFFLFLLVFYFVFSNENKDINFKDIFCILFGALLSFSRTVIISIVIFAFLYGIYRIFSNQENLRKFYLTLSIFLLSVIFLVDYGLVEDLLNPFFEFSLSLFGRERTAMIDSSILNDSRMHIWKMSLPIILEKPLIGHGPLSALRLLPYPTHNTILNLLLDYGVIGISLYFGMIKSIFFKLDSFLWFPLVFIPMMMLDLGNFRLIFVLVGVILHGRKINMKEGGKTEKIVSYN